MTDATANEERESELDDGTPCEEINMVPRTSVVHLELDMFNL